MTRPGHREGQLAFVDGTNADLVAAVAPLYLTGSVLDVTYGDSWLQVTCIDSVTGRTLSYLLAKSAVFKSGGA